ncbi:MAG: metal-dependent hydrolase [Leptospiraceae bacterium]|nr:metal-dependent hydrolase [Leptospiraceae bacterium]
MAVTTGIKVRHVDFGLGEEDIPRNWLWGNQFATHFVNSLHLVFPDGEKFFIRSVKAHEEFIKDPELKKRVKAFIAQEVTHGNEHKKFWNTLKKQGYDIQTFLDLFESTNFDTIEKYANQFLGAKHSLAVTVALEHLTASLAEYVFNDLKELEGTHEDMRQMLLWHAAEEIEHKSVAFDVLKEVDDSYALRMKGMIQGAIFLVVYTLIGFFLFMSQEIKRGTKFSLFEFGEFIYHFHNLGIVMGKEILNYANPNFHPDLIPNEKYSVEFFEKYYVEKNEKRVA